MTITYIRVIILLGDKKMLKICDGNKACSDIAYYFSEISSIYPITPSSPMASNIDSLSKDKLNLYGDSVKVELFMLPQEQ